MAGYLARATLYQDLGELDEAIADFTKSINLDPSLDAAFVGRRRAMPDLLPQATSTLSNWLGVIGLDMRP